MLRRTLALLVVFAVLASPAASEAPADEIARFRDRLIVLHDGKGHYLVTTRPDAQDPATVAYYGDGKQMYGTTAKWGLDSDKGVPLWELGISDMRIASELRLVDGAFSMRCGEQSTRLSLAGKDVSARILKRATYARPRFDRFMVALAFDDSGVFYYVDAMSLSLTERTPFNSDGEASLVTDFHLYIGKRGALKRIPLREVINIDMLLLVTARGSLKLRFERAGVSKAEWIQGDKHVALNPANLSVAAQARVFGGEFGIYSGQRFDTPCDDL